MLFRLIGFALLMETAAALAISMAGGDPFDFDVAWQSLGLLALFLLGILFIIGLLFKLLRSNALERRDAITFAIFATLPIASLALVLMHVGTSWLTTAFAPFGSARNWWPIMVLAVSLAGAWLLQPRSTRRVRS